MASLKKLSQALDVSVGFLKSLKDTKKSKDEFISSNTANCCRSVAYFTGFMSEKGARKAIYGTISLLYVSNTTYARRLEKVANKHGEEKKKLLLEAAEAIKSNNFQEYNRIITKNKGLLKFKRKCAKTLKKDLIDKLRCSKNPSPSTAKTLLMAAKSPNGFRIIVPAEKLYKEVEARVKRWGATSSLFWHAAKKLNPKIKPSIPNIGTLPKEKRKKHKMTNGMSYKAGSSNNSASAVINHRAEKLNSKFKAKLLKRIAQQEKFWSKQAEKQIIAAGVLNKLIEKV